jgi:monoamine oxidase
VTRTQVVVVGAGMSGLTAARALRERGVDTLIVDKGRAVGPVCQGEVKLTGSGGVSIL